MPAGRLWRWVVTTQTPVANAATQSRKSRCSCGSDTRTSCCAATITARSPPPASRTAVGSLRARMRRLRAVLLPLLVLALTPATAGAAVQLGAVPGRARGALRDAAGAAGAGRGRPMRGRSASASRCTAGARRGGRRWAPIVAIAGEAGEGTTAHRDALLRLFRPLTARRDLVLVDRRGTGRSSAVRCAANAPKACAGRLGERATLLGSGAAAEDLLTVLDELAIPRADLYAAGYATVDRARPSRRGTRDRLRSLVLDAPTVAGGDPWRRPSAAAYRRIVRAVCQASADCRAVKGDAAARLGSLAGRLARGPVAGLAHLTDLVAARRRRPQRAARARRRDPGAASGRPQAARPPGRGRRRTPRRRASTAPGTPRRASTGRCPGARWPAGRSRRSAPPTGARRRWSPSVRAPPGRSPPSRPAGAGRRRAGRRPVAGAERRARRAGAAGGGGGAAQPLHGRRRS